MTFRLLRPGEPQPDLSEAELFALANEISEAVHRRMEARAEEFRKREQEMWERIERGESPWA